MDRVESESEIEAFFRQHPGSLVVAEEKRSEELIASGKADWSGRVVRDFEAARRRYIVLGGP
jgi:hypothetical protein